MKMVMVAVLMVVGLNAKAAKKAKTISKEAFVEQVKQYFTNTSGGPEVFSGELQDLGVECTVSLEANDKGQLEIVLKGEEKVILSLPMENSDKVKLQRHEDADGSFQSTYQFGYYGAYKLVITHLDDAYDTIDLSNGTTTLECGAYY